MIVGTTSPRITEVAVGIVFDDEDVEALRQLGHGFAPLDRQRPTGRVLEGRREVHELHRVRLEDGLHRIRDDAIFVCVHLCVARLIRVERLQRPEVSRSFDDDDIAWVHEDFGDGVEDALRAARDEYLVRRRRHTLVREEAGQSFAQGFEAFRGVVLERLRAILFVHEIREFAHDAHGEAFVGRQPARQRNHSRLVHHLQDFADGARAHGFGAFR